MTPRQLVIEYLETLSGRAKTRELIGRFVKDPALIEHIEQVEAAFPGYELAIEQTVAEGDWVATRGTFRGTHQGEFGGIAATGRKVSAGLQIMYQVADGKIIQHWLQFDLAGLLSQLQ